MITATFEYKNQPIIVNFSDDFFKHLAFPKKNIEKHKNEWLKAICQNAAQTLFVLKGSPYEADAMIKVPNEVDRYHGLLRYNETTDHEFEMNIIPPKINPIKHFILQTSAQKTTLDPLEATIIVTHNDKKKSATPKKSHKKILEEKQNKTLEESKRNFETSIKTFKQKETLIEYLLLLNQQLANRKRKTQSALQQIEIEFKHLSDNSSSATAIQERIFVTQQAIEQIYLLERVVKKTSIEELNHLATSTKEYTKEDQEKVVHFLEAMTPIKNYLLYSEFNERAIKNLISTFMLTKTFSEIEKNINSLAVSYSQEIFADLKITLSDMTKLANESVELADATKSYKENTKTMLDETYLRIQKLAQTFHEQHQSLLLSIKERSKNNIEINAIPEHTNMETETLSLTAIPVRAEKQNDIELISNSSSPMTLIPTSKTSEDIKKLTELSVSLKKISSIETTSNHDIKKSEDAISTISKIKLVDFLVTTCLKNLPFWHKQVKIGGTKVTDGHAKYHIPRHIFEMLLYAKNSKDKTTDEKQAEAFLLGIQDIAKNALKRSTRLWFLYDFGIRKTLSTQLFYTKLATINPSARAEELYHQLETWVSQQTGFQHTQDNQHSKLSMK